MPDLILQMPCYDRPGLSTNPLISMVKYLSYYLTLGFLLQMTGVISIQTG